MQCCSLFARTSTPRVLIKRNKRHERIEMKYVTIWSSCTVHDDIKAKIKISFSRHVLKPASGYVYEFMKKDIGSEYVGIPNRHRLTKNIIFDLEQRRNAFSTSFRPVGAWTRRRYEKCKIIFEQLTTKRVSKNTKLY